MSVVSRGGGGEVTGHGRQWFNAFLLLEALTSLWVGADGPEAAEQRGSHAAGRTRSNGEKEERNSRVRLQIIVVPARAEQGSSAFPFTSTGQRLKNNTEGFIRGRERVRVCKP